ncbi:MAG: glycosyltransferase family 9 protein [Fimbriimonadaceae bacterium]|nr:glycosyltransferase family 9 protein [Fimbriimonadaceae bacterium]
MARFLVSRLSSLGDVVCSLPAASALKRGHPGCEIVWVVDPRFAGVVECCGAVDRVVRARPGFRPSSWPRHEGEFEAALDLQGLLKSALAIARARVGRRVGYHWQREGAQFFSDRVLPDPSSHHIVDQYVDVARAVGGVADRAEFRLEPNPEARERVRAKLAERGVAAPYVVVNPGAAWATKRWPAGHFASLIDRIQASGVRAVLIGGNAEADRASASGVEGACSSSPANVVGETSIVELIALVGDALGHVGGDTGSTHLAAAMDVPAFGLYSITRPQRSCPYGQIERCFHDPDSLAGITPDAVWDRMLSVMP